MPLRAQSSAEYDAVTNLPSMFYFRQYAGAYVRYAHQFGQEAYLIYFNLENFSVFNERYGFDEGDKLLNLTAVAIQAAFPGYLVSRFSDDHFLIVCASSHLEEGILQVHEQVHAYGRNANVMVKAGIYVLDDDTSDIALMSDRAKTACESIAHRYDYVYRWYDDALSWSIERSKYVESHIDQAINNGWIKVYYQPIVRSITEEVCELEALSRWDDPRYGLLSPAVFIDVLERSRLIHKLDAYVIQKVCSDWGGQRDKRGWRVPISVNLSRLDFELCDVFELVESLTRRYNVPRGALHLEVTESALNEKVELLSASVSQFRNAGYQVWLDDFGSGYSSLNTLKDYKFDVVKIDMAFLREFESKPNSRVIIASVVNMAKQLGMQTLIEGVETSEQFEFLRNIGCELIQGYLIGKPAPGSEVEQRVLGGELVMENSSLHGYYDRLGQINTLSATPFEFVWDSGASDDAFTNMLPLAIMEREMGEYRFVVCDETFKNALGDLGLGSPTMFAARLTDGADGQSGIIREAIRVAVATGRVESVDVMIEGNHCVFSARHVESHEGVDALLVSFSNLSHLSDLDDEHWLKVATRYLYAVYDEINVVNLTLGTTYTIFRGSTALPIVDPNTPIQKALDLFGRRIVHPKDRSRFRSYTDISTVGERAIAADRHYLADAFRLLQQNGLYEWVTIVLVPIQVEGDSMLLLCLRRTNNDVLSTVAQEDKIPKSLLWDTLVNLVPAGVFWKDEDRRFVGVNKNFLDFYAFDSVNDVLGKNDEEMGWHVSTDAFKNDELRVLEGDSIINAKGTCIARGGVRDILASKIPLRRDGRVVGLLGYFTDQTKPNTPTRKLILDGFDRMAETDQLTGIPNLQGFRSYAVSYQDAYSEGGIDFACIVLDVDDMSDLNEAYGHSFGNQVLKTMARTLAKACGVSGSVARVGGDKFAALKQVADADGAQQTAEKLVEALHGVKDVAGIRLSLACSVGWALFSERGDLGEVLELADKRMHDAQA